MAGGNNKAKYPYEEYHKEVDGVLYKKCAMHNKWFPNENDWFPCNEDYFYTNKKNLKDGLHPNCKQCEIKRAIKWKEENPEKDKIIKKKQNQKPENKAMRRKAQQAYIRSEKYQTWLKNNADKLKEYSDKRQHKNHVINNQEWEACKNYFNNSCAYCGLHIDNHYRIYAGKLQKIDLHKEHVLHYGTNTLENCVPSCQDCNCSKWEFLLDDWYNKDNPNFTQERLDKILKWINEEYKNYIMESKPKRKYKKRDKN